MHEGCYQDESSLFWVQHVSLVIMPSLSADFHYTTQRACSEDQPASVSSRQASFSSRGVQKDGCGILPVAGTCAYYHGTAGGHTSMAREACSTRTLQVTAE